MSVSLPSYTRIPTQREDASPAVPKPSPPLPASHHLAATNSSRKRPVGLASQIRRPQVLLAGCAALLVLSLVWNKSDNKVASRSRLTGASREDADEFACNPFETNGRLRYDPEVLANNVWEPYDQRCRPSNYMSSLATSRGEGAGIEERLLWFANRTIVLHSDSIDRFHMKDFCDFVGGRLANINPQHPASPPMYRDPHADAACRKQEDKWSKRPPEGWELTSPWVCDVERYGTTLVNVFQFGLEGGESFYGSERWYYPPARWDERLEHITVPLLRKLAGHYNRPQIEHPDLVVINSGYWDLRRYTEEDFVAAGFTTRPYPEDSGIPHTPLSLEREQAWEREARKAIKLAAKTFRGEKSGKAKDGPTLLWRTLHHPPRHNYAPFARVEALDSLARKVITDLRASQTLPAPATSTSRSFFSSFSYTSEGASPPLDPSLYDSEPTESQPLGLDRRLRIDNSGRLMLGQEHLFRDLLHPLPMPGSWLWGNVVLYELKRAVEGVDR
ncbi:hypothetical protein JCM10908_006140 [Rhodotorula pacifica]|uniref:uncharacterized protein n=1 Tax=Rhodotorula pacifica TaxID=1495444 RepID=UPI0031828DF4